MIFLTLGPVKKRKEVPPMPYCPKCDMEFVDGVTACTDCGGPLAESREAAMALQKEEKEKHEEEMRRQYEEFMAASEAAADDTEDAEQKKPVQPPVRAYVKKEQRYEDVNSSASAFFLVGGILTAAAIVLWTGLVHLPMAGISKYIFQGILTVMAAGCLAIAVSSKKSAGQLKIQADQEERETEEILHWFMKTYSGDDLDSQILSEDPDLSSEELSLKRFELIQDYLITGRDIPDQSYVDSLCDQLYSRLYEDEK